MSVIIPTRHRPELLSEVLQSVAAQTQLPTEVIIGDDSDDDRTEHLLTGVIPTLPMPVRYLHHRPALGESGNVDALYSAASGDLVLHLHDDDPIYPRCVEALVDPFVRHPEIVASFGLQWLLDEHGTPVDNGDGHNHRFFRTADRAGLQDGFLAGATAMFPNNGFLVRRDAALKIGYQGQGRAGRAVDFYFGFRLGQLGAPMYFVHELVSYVRLTAGSASRSTDADNAYHLVRILLEDCSPDRVAPEIADVIARNLPGAVRTAVARGETDLARQWTWSRWYKPRWTNPSWYRSLVRCTFG